jgi:ketosteroid isomerase-like protein
MEAAVSVAQLAGVLDAYEAIVRRDLERVMELLGEDPVVQTRVETHSGTDAVGHMFAEAFATEFSHQQEALLIDGPRIVVLGKISLVGPSTGIQTEQEILEVWSFDESGHVRMRVTDRDEGLRETDLERRAARAADVYESFEALNRGDFEGATELLHPDVELDRGEQSLESETIKGIEELERFMEPDVFENQQMEVQQIIDAGDRALVCFIFRARGAGSGIELANRSYQVATLRDEKVARLEMLQDRGEALKLLLSPPPD